MADDQAVRNAVVAALEKIAENYDRKAAAKYASVAAHQHGAIREAWAQDGLDATQWYQFFSADMRSRIMRQMAGAVPPGAAGGVTPQ